MPLAEPRAPKITHLVVRHGQTTDDPYAWLKDPKWQQVLQDPSQLAPPIRAYLEAENAYTEEAMADTAALRTTMEQELRARLKEDDQSVPLRDGPYLYFQRFEPGQQYPKYWRRPSRAAAADDAGDELLLDVLELAAGHKFCRLGGLRHSPDHQLMAYNVDFQGSERFELRVQAIGGAALCDVMTDCGSGFAWGSDGCSLYYTALDTNLRAKWVKRHVLGTDPGTDQTLYEEPDDGFFMALSRSKSGRFIMLEVYDHASSEVHLLDATNPVALFERVEPRRPGVIYQVRDSADRLLITLHEGAEKDGAVLSAPLNCRTRSGWQPAVPFVKGRLIQESETYSDYLVLLELDRALPRLVVHAISSGEEHEVTFDEAAYHLTLVPGYEHATEILRFTYSSMATPERTFDYNMHTRERTLLKEQAVPGHDPQAYQVERLTCVARDGALVPITLLRHKVRSQSGAPLLLYGYGAYGRSMPTSFSPHRFSLVDRGFSYAIAHIRGGKEKGYAWYEGAKVLRKANTFFDFIDVAETLVKSGVTRRGKIFAHGGSAGGMLMGVVANLAPALFAGIIADVPFVDVLNTMWDKELPLTPPEWPEWGNPILSQEEHNYIASYSPYENVSPQAYPPLLVLAGLTDPRVTYWEPAKWVARLREKRLGQSLLMLTVDMAAGHAGASGRFEILKRVALIYSFVLKVSGRTRG